MRCNPSLFKWGDSILYRMTDFSSTTFNLSTYFFGMLFAFLVSNRNIVADIYTLQDGCRLFITSFILFSSFYIHLHFCKERRLYQNVLYYPVFSLAKELNNNRNHLRRREFLVFGSTRFCMGAYLVWYRKIFGCIFIFFRLPFWHIKLYINNGVLFGKSLILNINSETYLVISGNMRCRQGFKSWEDSVSITVFTCFRVNDFMFNTFIFILFMCKLKIFLH